MTLQTVCIITGKTSGGSAGEVMRDAVIIYRSSLSYIAAAIPVAAKPTHWVKLPDRGFLLVGPLCMWIVFFTLG
jgi:hypothetical protein